MRLETGFCNLVLDSVNKNNIVRSAFRSWTLPAADPMPSQWCFSWSSSSTVSRPSATQNGFCFSSSLWNTVAPLHHPQHTHTHTTAHLTRFVFCHLSLWSHSWTSNLLWSPSLPSKPPLLGRLYGSTSNTLNGHDFVYMPFFVYCAVCILRAATLYLNCFYCFYLTSASVVVPCT